MFQLNYDYFRVYWNRYKHAELKKIYRGYQLTKDIGHYSSLTKKNCLQWLEILSKLEELM